MEFTDAQRAEIAAEHDRLAAHLWPLVEKAEREGRGTAALRLRAQACDAEDIAEAALARLY